MRTMALLPVVLFVLSAAPLSAQKPDPPKPVKQAVTVEQLVGKYREADKVPHLVTDYLWDFRSDGTVVRTGRSSFGDELKGPSLTHQGKYQIRGVNVFATLDGINLDFLFDCLDNGDLIPSKSMGYVKPIQMKKQVIKAPSPAPQPAKPQPKGKK